MTKAQKAIMETLDTHGHITADFAFNEVRKQHPNIALGTVYRNLNQFAEKKLIRRISRGGAPDIFDVNVHDHSHAICVNCGEARDVVLPGMKEIIDSHVESEVLGYEVLAYYGCGKCD